MKIKLLFLSLVMLAMGGSSFAQNVLPNISYNGQLTSSCSTPNAPCTNAVFVTTLGISGSPQTSGAGSTLDVPVQNYAAAMVTISGTYSGVTIGFDFSDPTAGTNYFQEVCARTDINLLEASEVVPTNQIRAWQCPVWAALRFRVRASAYGSGSANINITLTQAAIDPSLVIAASITNIAGASDPCSDVSAIKSSVPINITTATTTQLVALSGTTAVYACGFTATIAQTSTTPSSALQFEYGTGASCGTGTTLLTGAMAGPIFNATPASTPAVISPTGSRTQFNAPSGNALCAVSTGGTGISIQGYLTYVQQ